MGRGSPIGLGQHRAASWLDHPAVAAALAFARYWCPDDSLGENSVFGHALEAVDVLCGHLSEAAPEVVAAVLLKDSHDLVPPSVDLDATLATLVSWEVARIVRALRREHDALGRGDPLPVPSATDLAVAQASAADKIVTLRAALDGAERSPDPAAYWSEHRGFVRALPCLRTMHHSARLLLPPAMAAELGSLVTRLELGVARTRWPGAPGSTRSHP